MAIVQQKSEDTSMTKTELNVNEDPNEMMMMSTLSLPSNATSIRADITDGFSCENKTYGYYADVDNDCQIFHVCLPVTYADGKENTFRWSFICPEDTIFSQDSFTCMRPDDMTITCEESYQYYELNRHFGMIESNTDKETSNEVVAESNENIAEAEQAAPVKPVEQEEEEQIVAQSKPVSVAKPSRRKPSSSYAAQRKPINTYPLRKIPQTPVQSLVPEPSANHFSQVTKESMKPAEEEDEQKPVVNKFFRRPVTSFNKDKTPESANTQVSSATTEEDHPVEEAKIKPVVHKFSRRPVTVMNNSFKDKIQNTKTENDMPSRTDLFNQLRKRPSLFNKKPTEQPEEEQAKVEIPQEQPNFSPLATDMSNTHPETHMADTEIEVSESNHVFAKPQEANEMKENADTTNHMSEEPAQVLKAFEEIPAIISKAVESPNAQAEEAHKEQTLIISNEKSDNSEEPQIIEAVQSAEDSEMNENVEESPAPQGEHLVDETQTIIKMPTVATTQNIEEVQIVPEAESAQEPQAVEENPEIVQGLRTSAEVFQGFDETKTVEEPLNKQETKELHSAEEMKNVAEPQAAVEMSNIEEHQVAVEPHTAQGPENVEEVVEEMQNIEDHQVAEEPLTIEEIQNALEHQAEEEIQKIEEQQVAEESEAPKETQITEQIKVDEEAPADEEVLTAEEVPAAAEILTAVDKTEAEEETQVLNENAAEMQTAEIIDNAEKQPVIESNTKDAISAPAQSEASASSAEDNMAEDPIGEQIQSAEEVKAVEESVEHVEEAKLVEEHKPLTQQVEEPLVPEASEGNKSIEETVEAEKVATLLDSKNVDEPAIVEQHSEESDNEEAAAQTLEKLESEKPAGAPESMPATIEMSQPKPLMQQMYEDMNKHSLKGFNPVDPAMAQEAEQLIADFINTLRKNDFTNETPGIHTMHYADETSATQEAESSITDTQDKEEMERNQENVEETNKFNNAQQQQDDVSEDKNENPADTAKEMQDVQEIEEVEDSKPEIVPEDEAMQDSFALKSLETQNADESQPAQEPVVVEAMNLPQEMYQIPVKVITDAVEEQSHENETPAKTEENSQDDEIPAVHLAGNKPLSIDDIVELVKERLDQMPKNEMKTPMQLEHVLGEAQEEKIHEEQLSSAVQEDEQQPNSQSVEETVMPIYQRIAEPILIDADEQSVASEQNPNVAEQSPQTLEDKSEIKEKTNRSYKTKLDSRKRRFLFKADSS